MYNPDSYRPIPAVIMEGLMDAFPYRFSYPDLEAMADSVTNNLLCCWDRRQDQEWE